MRSGHYFVYVQNGQVEGMMAFYNDGNAFVHTHNEDAKLSASRIVITSYSIHYTKLYDVTGKILAQKQHRKYVVQYPPQAPIV